MVRSLALGEVGWKNMKDVFAKELLVGISNGIALGVLAGGVGYVWSNRNPSVGLALACAMVSTILLAGILGTLIPLLLNRLNIDPAVASGIFLHTLTDVISFFSFLGLATLFWACWEPDEPSPVRSADSPKLSLFGSASDWRLPHPRVRSAEEHRLRGPERAEKQIRQRSRAADSRPSQVFSQRRPGTGGSS